MPPSSTEEPCKLPAAQRAPPNPKFGDWLTSEQEISGQFDQFVFPIKQKMVQVENELGLIETMPFEAPYKTARAPRDAARPAEPGRIAETGARNKEMLRGPNFPTQIISRDKVPPLRTGHAPDDAEIRPGQPPAPTNDDRVMRKRMANPKRLARVAGDAKKATEQKPTGEEDEVKRERRPNPAQNAAQSPLSPLNLRQRSFRAPERASRPSPKQVPLARQFP